MHGNEVHRLIHAATVAVGVSPRPDVTSMLLGLAVVLVFFLSPVLLSA